MSGEYNATFKLKDFNLLYILNCKNHTHSVCYETYDNYYFLCSISIWESLEMVARNGKHKLVGFVALGEGHDLMASLCGMLNFYTVLISDL